MIITGISGMSIGDGAGGKVALSIQERILRILADTSLTFRAASILNAEQVKAGLVYYHKPMTLLTENYGDGTTGFQTPQINSVAVPIDQRKTAKYTYKNFDPARMANAETVLNHIATIMASSIENTLNAEFINYLVKLFSAGGELENANQTIVIPKLATQQNAFSQKLSDEIYSELMLINNTIIKMSLTFNRFYMGVPKNEIFGIVSPWVDINITNAFRNQPSSVGEMQLWSTFSGKQIQNFKYLIDSQLDMNFVAEQSFAKEAYNFEGFAGFLLHNEAVAFPINFEEFGYVKDPNNLDPRFIYNYQFGVKALRPELIYALKKA